VALRPDAFLADILAHPDDDTPRLVYADWLAEHGDPDRAAFIRTQIEAHRSPEFDRRRYELNWQAARPGLARSSPRACSQA
jgi:uncharacterized protein (TIGR02996 family)